MDLPLVFQQSCLFCVFHTLTYAYASKDVLNIGGEKKSLQPKKSKMLCCALEGYIILFLIFLVDLESYLFANFEILICNL
jgi:hypothetical protein